MSEKQSDGNVVDQIKTEKDLPDPRQAHQPEESGGNQEQKTDASSLAKKAREGKDNPEGPN